MLPCATETGCAQTWCQGRRGDEWMWKWCQKKRSKNEWQNVGEGNGESSSWKGCVEKTDELWERKQKLFAVQHGNMRLKVSMEWKEADMRSYRKNKSVLEEKSRGTLSGLLSLDECALCGKSCALFKITSFPPVSLLARQTSTSNSATSGCLASTKMLSKQINNLWQS